MGEPDKSALELHAEAAKVEYQEFRETAAEAQRDARARKKKGKKAKERTHEPVLTLCRFSRTHLPIVPVFVDDPAYVRHQFLVLVVQSASRRGMGEHHHKLVGQATLLLADAGADDPTPASPMLPFAAPLFKDGVVVGQIRGRVAVRISRCGSVGR